MTTYLITYEHEVRPLYKKFSGKVSIGTLAVSATDMAGAYRVGQKQLGHIKRLRIVRCEEVNTAETERKA